MAMSDVSAGNTHEHAPATMSERGKPDGHADPAGEAGWYLQRERERRGESLEQAGEATGIHPYHIEAIEWGDMTRMPARLDALEMIGLYAQYLGFDPEPLVRHYMKFLPKLAVAPAAHPADPAPLSSAKVLRFGKLPRLPQFNFSLSGIPGGTGGLVAGLAGAIFLFAGASWILLPTSAQPPAIAADAAPAADPMPTASTGAGAADVAVTDEPMTDAQPQTGAAAPLPQTGDDPLVVDAQPVLPAAGDEIASTNLDGLTQLITEKVKPGKADPTKPIATANAAKPAKALPAISLASADDVTLTPGGREFGAKTGGARLILKARAPVWVRVEDKAGKVVMTQMLQKGDTYRVPDRDGLVVIARDGGLLSYVIDGKEKGVLGAPGEILTGRSLDIKDLSAKG